MRLISFRKPVALLQVLTACIILFIVVPYIYSHKYSKDSFNKESTFECSLTDRAHASTGLKEQNCSLFYSLCLTGDNCNIIAVILVRIYDSDSAQWSKQHLDQWIRYMFYAGVSHIHLYDNYQKKTEKLRFWVQQTFSPRIVSYHDWSRPDRSYGDVQRSAYQDAVIRHGKGTNWQIALDMDEYPFVPSDIRCGFLSRAVNAQMQIHSEATELSLKSLIFHGEAQSHDWVIGSYIHRRTKPTTMELDKPVYFPSRVREAQVHHNILKGGVSIDVDPEKLRINHYWGRRVGYGDDTEKSLADTVKDDSVLALTKLLDNTVRCFDYSSL